MENNIGIRRGGRTRAAVVVIKDDKVLLLRRVKKGWVLEDSRKRNGPDTKFWSDYFVFPGGGVDPGETIEEAAVREAKEELGFDVKLGRLLLDMVIRGQRELFYAVSEFSGELALGGPEAERMSDENQYHFVWLPVEEAFAKENLCPPEARDGIRKALGI